MTADGLKRGESSGDRSRTASVVSLVAGLMFFVPLVAQAIGIVAGIAALYQSRHGRGRTRLAWVGLTLSMALLAAWIVVFAVSIPGFWNSAGRTASVGSSIGGVGGPITGGRTPIMAESDPQAAWQWRTIAGQVQKASASFKRDYGRWPASIDAMRGRSLPLEFSLPEAITYRPVPKRPAANPQWILLVSDPTPWGLDAESLREPHRLIQRLGGASQMHPTDKVARWLADQDAAASAPSFERVEAGCGKCVLGMKGVAGCMLAVRIDGKTYLVSGSDIDDHGDAHADDGLCRISRTAHAKGRIVGDRFVATEFELSELRSVLHSRPLSPTRSNMEAP